MVKLPYLILLITQSSLYIIEVILRPVVNGFHQSIHTAVSEVEGHIGVGQDGLLWQEAP